MPRLTDILEGIWGLLEESVVDRRSGFRQPAFATSTSGAGCAVRTVLLRAVDRKRRCVRFYTDVRSPKVEQILKDPRAALVFQDGLRQVELRAEATVDLHSRDALADRCWATLPVPDRREFATAPPGSPAGELSEVVPGEVPERGDTVVLQLSGARGDNRANARSDGRANFAVADCSIARLDWRELDSAGQRRAVFTWDLHGGLDARWVTP